MKGFLNPLRYLCLGLAVAILCIAPFCFVRAMDAPAAAPQVKAMSPLVTLELQSLQKLLTQYQELAANGGWPAWKPGKTLLPGQLDARVPTLRQILAITGDYPAASGIPAASTHYDATLAQAVRRFQSRHGLNADGHLGKTTQLALAVPVEKRIVQITATLERMRSHSLPAEDKYILVNLPAFTLYGVRPGAMPLTMRVIIGNRNNHTPLFDNVVTDVIFNPPWHVPARIARNEMLPKLRANPSYFVNAGFVVTQDGVEVDPMTANPDDGNLAFRQRPGDGNALGKIKFNIPDSDDIYLHSTASPRLFEHDERALSHGCIRVEKPRELAYFVMSDTAGWTRPRIDHSYDGDTQKSVRVTEVPVHLVYWTVFVDGSGVPYFYGDVYGKDKAAVTAQNQAHSLLIAAK